MTDINEARALAEKMKWWRPGNVAEWCAQADFASTTLLALVNTITLIDEERSHAWAMWEEAAGEREAAVARLAEVEKERDESLETVGRAIINLPPELRSEDPSVGVKAMRASLATATEALEQLIERADESDSAGYGTMATTYVRNTARAALPSIHGGPDATG